MPNFKIIFWNTQGLTILKQNTIFESFKHYDLITLSEHKRRSLIYHSGWDNIAQTKHLVVMSNKKSLVTAANFISQRTARIIIHAVPPEDVSIVFSYAPVAKGSDATFTTRQIYF